MEGCRCVILGFEKDDGRLQMRIFRALETMVEGCKCVISGFENDGGRV